MTSPAIARWGAPELKEFTPEEHATWSALFERQAARRPEQIVDWYSDGIEALGIGAGRIPRLRDVSERLHALTGFRGVAVDGFEDPRQFYPMLADRMFPVGNFIRDRGDLTYTPAPDVFHDLYGHLPFLTKPAYADFCHELGARATRYIDDPGMLRQYERLFWFTIEFALIETPRGRRIFGAGIASSINESVYALGPEPEVLPFGIEAIRNQEFAIDRFQERIFVLESERELYGCLPEFERAMRRARPRE